MWWRFSARLTFHYWAYIRRERKEERLQYLKNGESERVSQVIWGLQHFLPVVAIQVNTTEHVQLRVDPVQPAFDQIWKEDREHGQTSERRSGTKEKHSF